MASPFHLESDLEFNYKFVLSPYKGSYKHSEKLMSTMKIHYENET